jgi:hypothetical protein
MGSLRWLRPPGSLHDGYGYPHSHAAECHIHILITPPALSKASAGAPWAQKSRTDRNEKATTGRLRGTRLWGLHPAHRLNPCPRHHAPRLGLPRAADTRPQGQATGGRWGHFSVRWRGFGLSWPASPKARTGRQRAPQKPPEEAGRFRDARIIRSRCLHWQTNRAIL